MKTITRPAVEKFLRDHPGSTQQEIAKAFPNGNKIYGSHKFVASVVTQLRAEGKIEDVARCDKCNRALTRGRRNVQLFLTE